MQQSSVVERSASSPGLWFKRDKSADGATHEYAYSQDMTKRYAYSLTWNSSRPYILWVMLNPGTGETEERRRNTLERCKVWSSEWGFGGLLIGNVFATRTKAAKQLQIHGETSDAQNETSLRLLRAAAEGTIVAWGSKGRHQIRAKLLGPLLEGASCLGFTVSGEPRHPLYVSKGAARVDWPSPAWSRTDA
jgi:hypothetical protein